MNSEREPSPSVPVPGVLEEGERIAVERQFGVAEEQVVRDHVISHALAAIRRQLGRTLGTVTFTPHIRETNHPDPSVMQVSETRIQIQLLSSEGYPAWPTELVDIEQRYSDAPPARLRVLTPAAFVASKLAAWADREAPRDLYDLWALAEAGKIDAEAAALFGRFGPYTSASSAMSFTRVPTDQEWEAALAHQCMAQVGPQEAAHVVRAALASL